MGPAERRENFFCGGKNQTGIGSIGHGHDTLELFEQVSGVTFFNTVDFFFAGLEQRCPEPRVRSLVSAINQKSHQFIGCVGMGWQFEGTEIRNELKVSLNWRELLDNFFSFKVRLTRVEEKDGQCTI